MTATVALEGDDAFGPVSSGILTVSGRITTVPAAWEDFEFEDSAVWVRQTITRLQIRAGSEYGQLIGILKFDSLESAFFCEAILRLLPFEIVEI
jgi:hypothetical protein